MTGPRPLSTVAARLARRRAPRAHAPVPWPTARQRLGLAPRAAVGARQGPRWARPVVALALSILIACWRLRHG
jgi:hypothetical protein